jgi:CheY-like chemotaxis protein
MDPKQHCVLVAEDDAIVRYNMCQQLARDGYCILEASDGCEALERASEYDGAIQVLVTNMRMPKMDGHELTRAIKAVRPDIKVIIVSAHREEDLPAAADSHDFAFVKPVRFEALRRKIREMLEERAAREGSPDPHVQARSSR